jgi:hypothetical protein
VPTLAEIERKLARRTGPFAQFTASATTASTATLVYVDDLQSSVEQGGLEGLWLLRRDAASTDDRQRMVKTYEPDDGYLEVSRAYLAPPAANEALELMALEPSRQIRVAVQAGLDKCFVRDRVRVVIPEAADERDLTAALPWLTREKQFLGASRAAADTTDMPAPIDWLRAFEKAGRIWLGAAPDPYSDDFYVWALRPASSRINGLSAPACPVVEDVTTGGSLLANTVYNVAVAVWTANGTSPACPVVKVYTATDGSNTHVARIRIPQDAEARNYLIYASTHAAPKRVATISETQRAAGCTVTAVDTISATSPDEGYVDVRVAGTSTAAVQAASPSSDADVLDVPIGLRGHDGAPRYAWEEFKPDLAPIAAIGMGIKEDDVRRGAAYWRNRLPKPQERVQTAHPYAVTIQSAWSHPWNGS